MQSEHEPIDVNVTTEYVDVVPFSEQTRLNIPELSHAQELLLTPIPLENRIAYLLPYIEPTAEVFSVTRAARHIGASSEWVLSVSRSIGLEVFEQDDGTSTVSSIGLHILKEEREWQEAFNELSEYLSSGAIGKFIARSESWVEQTANELAVFPERVILANGQVGAGYPKKLIPQLRHILLVVPPAEDYLTYDALAEMTGRKKEWIIRRLGERGIQPVERRSIVSGKLAKHVIAESLEIIQELIQHPPKPAGNWLTIGAMEALIGAEYEWLQHRVNDDIAEERLGDDQRPRKHYPPEEVERLKVAFNIFNQFEYATAEDLTLFGVAKRTGHTQRWVSARLPYVSAEPYQKRNPTNNRLLTYYHKSIVDALLKLPADVLTRK